MTRREQMICGLMEGGRVMREILWKKIDGYDYAVSTSGELKAVQALDDSYEKLLKETDALILKLRPDDPEPDEEEYERIQASRLPEPVELKPEPIEVRDGTPVYSKEELDAYHNTDEYKA